MGQCKKYGITVVIPTYNRKDSLISAVESVDTVSPHMVEIIVVDDCSLVSPKKYLKEVNSFGVPIRVYENPRNRGPQVARNLGIRRAKFNYVAFLDSDDLFIFGKLDWLLNMLKNEDIDFIYHAVYGCEKYNYISRFWFLTIGRFLHFRWLLCMLNPCVTPSVVFRRKRYLFNPKLRYSEDYAFLLSYIDFSTVVKYEYKCYSKVSREIGSNGGVSSNLIKMRKGELQGKKNLLRRKRYFSYAISIFVAYVRVCSDLLRRRYTIHDYLDISLW